MVGIEYVLRISCLSIKSVKLVLLGLVWHYISHGNLQSKDGKLH